MALIGILAPLRGLRRKGLEIPVPITCIDKQTANNNIVLLKRGCVFTLYSYAPNDEWIVNVSSTKPRCLGRNTISNEVDSPGLNTWLINN